MHMRNLVKVWMCATMAAMLIGLPGFALLSSGAEPLNDVTDEFIRPIILNMMEDHTLQLTLTDYFDAKWMAVTINGQNHLSCVIDGVMLTISPSRDWYGDENIVITAIYPLPTPPPGVPLPPPSPPPPPPGPPTVCAIPIGLEVSKTFSVHVSPVNDPPITTTIHSTIVRMTSNSSFILFEPLNLDELFDDVDSTLQYSWENNNGLVTPVLDDNYLYSITSSGVEGQDIITIVARDEEYVTVYDISVNVESREPIPMTEDIIFESYLDQYIKSPNVKYELYSSEHISFEPRVLPDFRVNGVLTPELNWFGSGIIALQTFSEPLFIPLPPPVPVIMAVPPVVIPPVPPTPILKYAVEYGYFEFDVNVVSVNDPPNVDTEDFCNIRMTTGTTFDLSQPFDLNTLFDDVDSSMWFSWDTLNGLATLEMEENKLWSMTASGVVGEDIIYIMAHDEDYTTSYEIALDVEPRQNIPMMEDVAYQWELDNYINMSSQEYELIGSEHVSVETEVQPDETVIGTFSPDNDWFGSETINLWTYPELYGIIPPPINPVIMSAPPVGVIPPPIIQTIKEYGYFEFEVNVESVNDAPVMFEVPQIVLDEDNTLYEAFNIEDYFDDIDSLLVYEISTQSSKITALMGSDGSVDITPDENWFGTESIIISASDEEYTLSQEVEIQVLPVNDPPYVSGEATAITFDEDTNSTIYLTGYIEDIDSALWFSYLCDSENVSFELNETTWELCAVPNENWFGVLDLVIYGSDNECQVARNLTINVTSVNDPPECVGYEDVYLSEDTTTTIDVAAMFYDIDSELSLMVYSSSGMLSTEFTASSMVELRPNIPNWYGDETLTVVATDGEYSVSLEVPIHVEPINDCPVLTFSTLEYDIMEDSKLSLIVEKMFDDVDGDVLTYSFDAPEKLNAQYDEDKGLLTLIPVKDWYGTAKVSITVSDGSESANTELRLVVSPINDAPFQTGSIAMMVMNTSENRTINLADYFEDIEHEQLFFEVIAAVNLTVTAINSQGLFQIGAKNNWSGAENLVFTVSDGIDTIEIEVSVYVTSPPESTVESSLTSESNIFRSISLISLMLLAVAVAFFVLQGQGRRHGKARRTATNRDLII